MLGLLENIILLYNMCSLDYIINNMNLVGYSDEVKSKLIEFVHSNKGGATKHKSTKENLDECSAEFYFLAWPQVDSSPLLPYGFQT